VKPRTSTLRLAVGTVFESIAAALLVVRACPTLRCATIACVALLLASCAEPATRARGAASAAFERFAALQGDWVEVDAGVGAPGQVSVTYRVTGGGSAVVETLWPGAPDEMVSVYHLDGDDLVLTHYCSAGNQPHLRACRVDGQRVDFTFDGGSNIDPSRDMHMHDLRYEFVSPDEIRVTWQGWSDGAPDAAHVASFHFVRKPD